MLQQTLSSQTALEQGRSCTSEVLGILVGCALAVAHQVVLSMGIIDIIHAPERGSSLLSRNRKACCRCRATGPSL